MRTHSEVETVLLRYVNVIEVRQKRDLVVVTCAGGT